MNNFEQIKKLIEPKYHKFLGLVKRTIKIQNNILTLTDFSIRGIDDKIYENNYNLIKELPRGLCIVQNNDKIIYILYGLRKFGYNDHLYSEINKSLIVKEIWTTKENGECCHFGAFSENNENYFIIGSKNVHLVVRKNNILDDLKLYNEQRYLFAKEITELFVTTISNNIREKLFQYLLSSGQTFCAESISSKHQHMVKYEKFGLIFYGITSSLQNNQDILTSMNPLEAKKIFKKIGLATVDRIDEVIVDDKIKRLKIMSYFETIENSEGAVVYGINSNNEVIYMYKHKNLWYIKMRAVREILKKRKNNICLEHRLRNLHIEIDNLDNFIIKMKAFNSWLHNNLSDEDWHTLQDSFLKLLDKFSLVPETTYLEIINSSKIDIHEQLQIILMGIPGSGKSTIGRTLTTLFNGIFINQDDFEGKAQKFHNKISDSSKSSNKETLIIDKSMHNMSVRKNALEALNKKGRVIIIQFQHPEDDDGIENQIKLCIERIIKRGDKHKSLKCSKVDPSFVLNNIFKKQYQPLSPTEINSVELVINVNMILSPFEILKHIINILEENQLCNSFDDQKIVHALNLSLEIEESLNNYENNQQVGYWALKVMNNDITKFIPSSFLENYSSLFKIFTDNHHVTLKFLKRNDKSFDETEFQKINNQQINIQIKGFAFNDKIGAFVVIIPSYIYCDNKIPHITMALIDGIKPVESNIMLQEEHTFIEFDSPINIETIVTKF